MRDGGSTRELPWREFLLHDASLGLRSILLPQDLLPTEYKFHKHHQSQVRKAKGVPRGVDPPAIADVHRSGSVCFLPCPAGSAKARCTTWFFPLLDFCVVASPKRLRQSAQRFSNRPHISDRPLGSNDRYNPDPAH